MTPSDREAQAADLFARHKAKSAMRAIVTNLAEAGSRPYLVTGDKPLEGSTVYVVGAGPSLSRALPHLADLSRHGYVFAVNASARAVARVTPPDVVVVRESVDVAGQLEGVEASLIALDLCASPAVWDVCRGRNAGWFIAGAVQHFGLAARLGVRPLFAGSSAITAAVALAHELGAWRIVLVGCDLAFADGLAYAPESAWGGVTASVSRDHVELGAMAAQDRAHESVGQRLPPRMQSVTKCVAYGGEGEVSALWQWNDQREWLERFADRYRIDTHLVNATGAGSRIKGWDERGASDDITDAEVSPPMQLPTHYVSKFATAIGAIRADAQHILELATIDAAQPYAPRLTMSIVEAMAAGDLMAVREAASSPREAIEGSHAVLRAHAEWTLEATRRDE